MATKIQRDQVHTILNHSQQEVPGTEVQNMLNLSPELDRALRSATEIRIRTIVNLLCQTDLYVRDKISSLLLMDDESKTTANGANETESNGASKKRQRYEICEQCDQEFEVAQNTSTSCVWHSGSNQVAPSHKGNCFLINGSAGDKNVDWESDTWADHDEDCHGRIEDLYDDEDCQGGFQWDCCNKVGDAKGCEISEHTASVAEPKRFKLA